MRAGSGSDQVTLGSGRDTFVGGPGAATVGGGAGNDVFRFIKGEAGGSDLIQGFGGADKINLQGYGPVTGLTAGILASQVVSGSSVTITLPDSTKITFAGVTSLKATDFN